MRARADALRAAVDAIERGHDGDNDIRYYLTAYMTGRLGIAALQDSLEEVGIGPGSKIVHFAGGGR